MADRSTIFCHICSLSSDAKPKLTDAVLAKKSLSELRDLLAGQERILRDKRLCGRLADKGKAVKEKTEAIEVRADQTEICLAQA